MRLERADRVRILRIDTGKANAIDAAWLDGIERHLAELDDEPPGALVITGRDRHFCAGLHLPTVLALDRDPLESFIGQFTRVMLRLFRLPFPVVAAVNGHAIAGGCVLAMQADARLMTSAPGATIGLNEVVLGIGLPAVVVETLRSQIAPSALGPIALEGRLCPPDDALALGLVHEVVAPDQLEARALARAGELAALPGPAFAQIKRALRQPAIDRIQAAAAGDAARWADTWFSDCAQQTVRAALDRFGRRPA